MHFILQFQLIRILHNVRIQFLRVADVAAFDIVCCGIEIAGAFDGFFDGGVVFGRAGYGEVEVVGAVYGAAEDEVGDGETAGGEVGVGGLGVGVGVGVAVGGWLVCCCEGCAGGGDEGWEMHFWERWLLLLLVVVVEEEIRLNLLVADLLSIVLNVSSDDFTEKWRH